MYKWTRQGLREGRRGFTGGEMAERRSEMFHGQRRNKTTNVIKKHSVKLLEYDRG